MEKLNLNNRSELFNIAQSVQEDENINELAAHMVTIMIKNRGIGLAAPQIGVSKRLITLFIKGKVRIIINPKIIEKRLGTSRSVEGCLSFPGLQKTVIRSKMVIVHGFDENWKPVKYKLRGQDSMCIQHEIDHLFGITLEQK